METLGNGNKETGPDNSAESFHDTSYKIKGSTISSSRSLLERTPSQRGEKKGLMRHLVRIASERKRPPPSMVAITDTDTDISGALRSSVLGMTPGEEFQSSGSLESSEFLKMPVDRTLMSDNMGNEGQYKGTVMRKNGKPHGKGTMDYSNCDLVYSGQWVQGDWSGFGKLTDTATGMEYEGGFLDNLKHGLGVITYPDGRVYDASFQLGKMSHKGHLTWPDGCKYWGHWNDDGVPQGRGKKVFRDGSIYDGEFEHGVFQGHGRLTYPDGSWHLGEWQDGVANGLGMRAQNDGRLIHEGMYCHGNSLTVSSLPPEFQEKSSGEFLLYRSSVTDGRTLEGPLPNDITMRKLQFKC